VAGVLLLCSCSVGLVLAAWGLSQDAAPGLEISGSRTTVLDAISASSLEGHVSFLASDALEGRGTPSAGLDMAAEYIAAQFRRAGLEPGGNDGYFQSSTWGVLEPDAASFRCEVASQAERIFVRVGQVTLTDRGAIDLENTPLIFLKSTDETALAALTLEQVEGKAVACAIPEIPAGAAQRSRLALGRLQSPVVDRLKELKAGAVVWLDAASSRGNGLPAGRLIDPDNSNAGAARPAAAPARPVSLTIHDAAARTLIESGTETTLTLKLGAAAQRAVTLRNVAGILRGSDPELKDSFLIVSAHYDHLGVGGQAGQADHIFNGANDDASGTAMVIELAAALAKSQPRPKRSILFLTFFGEEQGLLGSRYYGRHPIVPLEQTAAMVNLEHMGRTDDSEGEQKGRASLTGFDFSDVGPVLERAGKSTDVEIFKHPRNSDSFFGRSDNQALADRGVPAHTLCTAFIFPDYHAVGDHWDKIDYQNMAKVGRAVALGLLQLADQEAAPRWNESNSKTSRYVKAWKAMHEKAE
jgi:hypothetical protein